MYKQITIEQKEEEVFSADNREFDRTREILRRGKGNKITETVGQISLSNLQE